MKKIVAFGPSSSSNSINKNKVVLINPPGRILVKPDGTIGERKHCTPPLGLAYLAASVRKANYDVEAIDMLAEGYETERLRDQTIIYGLTTEETVERIRKANPIMVGIGILFFLAYLIKSALDCSFHSLHGAMVLIFFPSKKA